MDDIENYLTRYTDRDDGDEDERLCYGCGFIECECDDDPDPDDCMNCGMCEWCIERSIAAAEDSSYSGADRDDVTGNEPESEVPHG